MVLISQEDLESGPEVEGAPLPKQRRHDGR